MPCVRVKFGKRVAFLTIAGDFKPGDPAPTGYLDWHEWAGVQHKAGLRQQECGKCGKWKFPQELSDKYQRWTAQRTNGQKFQVIAPLCKECEPAP